MICCIGRNNPPRGLFRPGEGRCRGRGFRLFSANNFFPSGCFILPQVTFSLPRTNLLRLCPQGTIAFDFTQVKRMPINRNAFREPAS
jgi:hypothetical protein